MAKFKPVRGRSSKRPAEASIQSNRIDNYFVFQSSKNDEAEDLGSTLKDLVINSPQAKKFKLDNCSKTPPIRTLTPHAKPNSGITVKCLTSPVRSKRSSVKSFLTSPKKSSSKSARCLFSAAALKSPRKRIAAEVSQEHCKVSVDVDVNSNLFDRVITKVNENGSSSGQKRKSVGSDNFKSSSTDTGSIPSLSMDSTHEGKLEQPMKIVTASKLVAGEPVKYVNAAESCQSEGLSFFKEVESYLHTIYCNPQKRLRIEFLDDPGNNDLPETLKRGCERDVYTESLMAVLQVHGFSDTALDLTRNYLSYKQYLSWKLIRSILYHSIESCSEDDFQKSLNLCLDMLMLHPPGAPDMRDYYLTLLNVDDEMTFDDKAQKGLIPYLMEAFAQFYKFPSNSKPKRAPKLNKKYYNESYQEDDEEDEEDEAESVIKSPANSPKKKRGRSKKGKSAMDDEGEEEEGGACKRRGRRKKPAEKPLLDDGYLESLDYSAKQFKEINNTICSVLSNIGRRSNVKIDQESLIDRQLQLFDFVINVLENDFVQWNKKNLINPREKLVSLDETPLVASVMFDRRIGFSSCSARMKEIFNFYAVAVPKHKKYFERLIALLAETTMIFEEHVEDWDDGNKLIKYPFLSEKCRNFTDEFFLIGFKRPAEEEWPGIISEKHIASLKSLRPPWLKLFVANRLLERSLGAKLSGNISSVIDVLKAHTFDETPTIIKTLQVSLTRVEEQGSKKSQPQSQYSKLRSINKVNEKINTKGETVIHFACVRKKPGELKKYLQVPMVNIFQKDNNGWLPIHDAASYGSVECTKLLCNYTSDFEERRALMNCRGGSHSSTPLLEAVVKDHIEVADYLLSIGGSSLLHHVNRNQESVSDLCCSEEMREILKKYQDKPPRKFLRIPSIVWEIIFALISSYFETYGTRICKKFKQLSLDSSNFHNVDLPSRCSKVCFQIDSSHYIRDLSLIYSLSELVGVLKENNPGLRTLKLLHAILN